MYVMFSYFQPSIYFQIKLAVVKFLTHKPQKENKIKSIFLKVQKLIERA